MRSLWRIALITLVIIVLCVALSYFAVTQLGMGSPIRQSAMFAPTMYFFYVP